MAEEFDLIIVGSGSGNSIPPFLNDHRIALVERDVFGGTCLNRGCIPSKMFVLPADLAVEAGSSERLGIDTQFRGADWPAIRDRVFGRIDPISEGGRDYRANGSDNVTLIEGTARFVAERVLEVDGRTITAPKILVAVGSRSHIPPIEGLESTRFHTSDTIMRLETFPSRLGIIGGGFIAAEMGHVFDGLGSEVTLFSRSARLMRHADVDAATTLTTELQRRIDVRLATVPSRVEPRGDEIAVWYPTDDGEDHVVVNELLVATGRVPNSDLVAAQDGGIDVDDSGVIMVDDQMRTSVDGVWAIGDVANSFQLKHLANAEAKVAFWNIAHPDEPRTIDYSAVPAAVFSHPQMAAVGLTEQDADTRGLDYVVGRRAYGEVAYGWALEDETSFAKVLIDRSTGKVLGAHIVGPQAATLIQPLIQAMQFGTPAAEVALGQFWIHPALTEVVENALLDGLEQLAD